MSGDYFGCVAKVKIQVDFPDAEGIWVVVEPVKPGGSISDALHWAGGRMIGNLAADGRVNAVVQPSK